MDEEWRDIESFPGYQVSNKGNVRSYYFVSCKKGSMSSVPKMLKPCLDDRGRPCVYLYTDGKRYTRRVSRLVGETFIPNPNDFPVLRHLNDQCCDNRVENLAWGTYSDNTQDCLRNNRFYRSYKPVDAYNEETGQKIHFNSELEAMDYFSVASSTMSTAISKNYKIKGFKITKSSTDASMTEYERR